MEGVYSKRKILLDVLCFLLGIICFIGCSEPAQKSSKETIIDASNFKITPATDWDTLLVRESGWIAADGIFTIPLDGTDASCSEDERILFLFSDTYIGKAKNGVPHEGLTMVNNTVAYLDGCDARKEEITFHVHEDEEGRPISFFIPKNSYATEGQYYWLGDGFVNHEKEGTLYIFAYHVEMTGPNVFDFRVTNVSILAIDQPSNPPFENYRQIETPLHIAHPVMGEGDLGGGIFVNTEWADAPNPDGFVYIYGCIGPDKNLVTARVKPQFIEDFSRYRYWNGEDWVADLKSIHASTSAVSNELSVTPLPDGRYLLTFQVMGLSEKIGCRIGKSLVGPWGELIELYETPESSEGMFTYNAKAHPALSKPDELIISYNTITLNFWEDIKQNVDIYRPRFIRLKYE